MRPRMSRRSAAVALSLGLLLALIAGPSAAVVGQPAGARPGIVRSTTWMLRNSLAAGAPASQFTFGLPGDRKLMGDWNGDGTRTPGLFRNGTWYLRDRNGPGGTYFSFPFGAAGDEPVVGDWNGDGIESIGFFRTGCWHLRDANSTGGSNTIACFGRTGDLPTVGDWNGDGIDTIGFFRTGCWHLRDVNSGGSSNHIACYGATGDSPVTGDWNTDGADGIGFFRTGCWHLRDALSTGPSNRIFCYGATGDSPVVWKLARSTVPANLVGTQWTRLPTTRKVVALTFDAGANANGVPNILATLRQTGVAATFFLTGQWVQSFPAATRDIGRSYPIGNHSNTHPHLPALPDDQVRSQITTTQARIRSATTQEDRPLFRFPFGDSDARTLGLVNSLSYGSIRWTVDTLGWQGTSGGRSVQSVVDRVLANLQPGEIVLMHVGSHPTDGSTLDADALPTIIAELRARGYGFTTVQQFT
jgi:peptidoglycan/xylan/chitin deacetylase (PgdA/CDA1 family)